MKIIKDVEMKDYTSFKAGGKANKMVICEREDEVIETLREIKEKNEKAECAQGTGIQKEFRTQKAGYLI